jgi:hypothetical protein
LTNEELEQKVNEANELTLKFSQIASGLMAAITVAFENHRHDENGKVVLSDDVRTMYEKFIPQEIRS